MNKKLFLTAFSLAAILATNGANASVETTPGQVKNNLETNFKAEPDKADYALVKPNGDEATLNDVVASDYDDFKAETNADGENVKLKSGIDLNIAQGSVDATDYQYLSTNADGVSTLVDGDTAVANLDKDFTLYNGSTLNVSTSGSSAPTISVGTALDGSDAIYKTGDDTFYLVQVGDEILLNGDANQTADNPATFNSLYALYEADVEGVNELYNTLSGYKQNNQNNFDAVLTAVDEDNQAIDQIVANQLTFTTKNAEYTADKAAYDSYEGSLAETIDKSINDASLVTLADAKDYADGLASNYDVAGAADTAESNAKDYADSLASNYDVAGAADTEQTRAVAAEATLQDNIDAEALARANADSALQNNIDNEVARATAQEAAIRGEIATGNARTLASANAYTDKKVDTLEKNVSGGVAAATALSAVEVSNVKKGEVSVGGGYGYYNSQSAMALGAAMGLSDSWSINAGAGIASGDKTQVAFRAGTNYKFKLF